MWTKTQELASSVDNVNENLKDIGWLIETIEEKVNGARSCIEDARTQLANMLTDILQGVNEGEEVVTIDVEDVKMVIQSLDDAENELDEL
jgi:chromosome segregation ATPase